MESEKYTKAGDIEEKIRQLAVEGLFEEAESLRDELLVRFPMELGAIVKTGEIIEEQKTKHLDTDHLATWKNLYDGLSSEEINCIYYSLKPVLIDSGKLLTAQGKANNRLFFIDSGKVGVFYKDEEKNKPVIQLSRGDVLGEETFFGISLCPLSAATISGVSLRYLNRREAESWHEKQPGLYEKVADFCRKFGKSEFAVQQKNSWQRKYQRYSAQGMVTAVIIGSDGMNTNTYFRGAIADISRSGTSFSMKCSKQETARALLSRRVDITIDFDDWKERSFNTNGVIVKVSFHLHNDYTVHVKFSEILGRGEFKSFPCNWSEHKEQ